MLKLFQDYCDKSCICLSHIEVFVHYKELCFFPIISLVGAIHFLDSPLFGFERFFVTIVIPYFNTELIVFSTHQTKIKVSVALI